MLFKINKRLKLVIFEIHVLVLNATLLNFELFSHIYQSTEKLIAI